MAKTAARYYVKLDTLWQGSPYYYAGPFATRDDAEQAIQDAAQERDAEMILLNGDAVSRNGRGLDRKNAIRIVDIVSQSLAMRAGLNLDPETGNRISRVPANADHLFVMTQPEME